MTRLSRQGWIGDRRLGWFVLSWSWWQGPRVPCNACGDPTRAGVVRAGNSRPRAEAFMVLCLPCGSPMLTTPLPGIRHGEKLQPPRHWKRGN